MKNRFSGFWKTFWKKGDFFTRLSLVVMGSGCFRFGQLGNGLLYLGAEALGRVVRHPALAGLPFVLETPNELEGYAREIALLKELRGE